FACIAAAEGHSWYPEECCHDKDCHPVPCEEIEKISDGWLWRDKATKQRYWFPQDRLHASHDDACHVCVRHRRALAAFVFMCRCQHEYLSHETSDNRGANAGAFLGIRRNAATIMIATQCRAPN